MKSNPAQPNHPALLYFEDLSVGQRFCSATHLIDAEQIMAFARQFDPQPFHLDAEAGQASLFQGLVASGWHTAALTMRLWVQGGWPIAGGLVGAGGEITWPRPVRPGDILRVEGEILEKRASRSNPKHGIVTVRNKTLTQLDEVVQIVTAKIVVPCRGASVTPATENVDS
jgi:acyl dehydratase